jgi:hypothetical protein
MHRPDATSTSSVKVRTADGAKPWVKAALHWREKHPDLDKCPAPHHQVDCVEWFAVAELVKYANANMISECRMDQLVKVRLCCIALILQV